MWKRIESWVHLHEAVLLILVFTVILRIPSLFEPYWYGDEGIYLTIGQAMRHGVELYKGIHDNKPPLLYLIAALANGELFWFRLITLIWVTGIVVLFWKLARSWFENRTAAIVSTSIFAVLTSVPLIEGNIGNAELYFLMGTVGSFYLLWRGGSAFWAGIILGVGALFKIPAGLEAGVWPLYWLIVRDDKWFRKAMKVGIGAILPMAISVIFFAWRGTLNNYLIAAGIQNVPYLYTWQPLAKYVGTLPVRGVILVSWLIVTWLLRNKIGRKAVMLSVWGGIGVFAALLSARPYPHYLLQIVPVVSLGLVTLFWGKIIEKAGAVVFVALVIGTVVRFNFYTYPIATYYSNFVAWVLGMKDREAYFTWFSPDVMQDYRVAKMIMEGTTRDDKIFVWGDRPVIYALSRRLPVGRYTTKYHILDFGAEKETIEALSSGEAKYIITMGEEDKLTGLREILSSKYIKVWENGNTQVYRLWKKF